MPFESHTNSNAQSHETYYEHPHQQVNGFFASEDTDFILDTQFYHGNNNSLVYQVASDSQMMSRQTTTKPQISNNENCLAHSEIDALVNATQGSSRNLSSQTSFQSDNSQIFAHPQLSPINTTFAPTSKMSLYSPAEINMNSLSLSESDCDSFHGQDNSFATVEGLLLADPFDGMLNTSSDTIDEILSQDPFLELNVIPDDDGLVDFIENSDRSIDKNSDANKFKVKLSQSLTTLHTSKLKKKTSKVCKRETSKSSLDNSLFSSKATSPIKPLKKSLSMSKCSIEFPLSTENHYSFVYETGTDEDFGVAKTKSQAQSRLIHQHYQYDYYKNPINRQPPKILKNIQSGLVEFQLNKK